MPMFEIEPGIWRTAECRLLTIMPCVSTYASISLLLIMSVKLTKDAKCESMMRPTSPLWAMQLTSSGFSVLYAPCPIPQGDRIVMPFGSPVSR